MSSMHLKMIPAAAVAFALLAWPLAVAKTPQMDGNQSVPNVVTCVALEAHPNAQPGTTVVLFHQRDKSDQARLASLLARADGSSVEIQTRQGKWVTASLVRLRNCFGRGLLLFPSGAAELKDHDVFSVKFGPPGPRG